MTVRTAPRTPTPEERERYGLAEDDRIQFIETSTGSYPVIVPGESTTAGEIEWDPSAEPPFEGKEPWQP